MEKILEHAPSWPISENACVNDIMTSQPRGGLVEWLRSDEAQVGDGGLDVGDTTIENNSRQSTVAGVGNIAETGSVRHFVRICRDGLTPSLQPG